jgi:hypothetical protein
VQVTRPWQGDLFLLKKEYHRWASSVWLVGKTDAPLLPLVVAFTDAETAATVRNDSIAIGLEIRERF